MQQSLRSDADIYGIVIDHIYLFMIISNENVGAETVGYLVVLAYTCLHALSDHPLQGRWNVQNKTTFI